MIKYTSKDIVERAEQLADLQNSDFISDSEKSALLNEAWNTLYQKIINANDRTFIKSVSAYDGMRLPKDFYQLSSLYVTKDKAQVDRINASQLQGYSVTNNTLLLSHEYDDIEITLEYYPTPKTIFYNSEKKSERSFSFRPLVIVDERHYISQGGIYDYQSGLKVADAYFSSYLNCSNGSIDVDDETSEITFNDLQGEEVTRRKSPFVVKGNKITYDEIKTDDDLSDFIAVITDDSEEQLYFVDFSGYFYDKDFKRIERKDGYSFDGSDSQFYCRADGLYVIDSEQRLFRCLGSVTEFFPLGLYKACAFVDGTDIILSFNGNYCKSAYGFSTLFDYPNNIYFTLLAYMLAVSFKMKQNGDVTLLNSKLEEATNQFFDSINRDANQFYIMKNVYQNGRGRVW